MSPVYRVTFDVVSELAPDEIQHVVKTGLRGALEITRLLVAPPRNAAPTPATEAELGPLELRVVERPTDTEDEGGRET